MELDLEQIGYFLYMQEQEEQLKVNVESEDDLVREVSTTNEKNFFKEKES